MCCLYRKSQQTLFVKHAKSPFSFSVNLEFSSVAAAGALRVQEALFIFTNYTRGGTNQIRCLLLKR